MSCFILTVTLLLFFHSPVTGAGVTNPDNSVTYHGGPLLTGDITVNIIWYGAWAKGHKTIIKEFLNSISSSQYRSPSVYSWWKTVRLYTGNVRVGREIKDDGYSEGHNLSLLSVKSMVEFAVVTDRTKMLPDASELYLFITSDDVHVEGFCSVCSLHNYTDPLLVGYKVPYAWVGNAAKLIICPHLCMYPFKVPDYLRGIVKPLKSPNGDLGVDSMVNSIGHEIVELVTNPFWDGWYGGPPTVQMSAVDACVGIHGRGGGASYPGDVLNDIHGASYNMRGIRRMFLVQWVIRMRDCPC